MQVVNLLIKPSSSSCNLKCEYCFYHDVAQNRRTSSYGMMKQGLLEFIVKKALEEAKYACSFAFQGGEPTLAGLDFYQNLIEYEKKYNLSNIKINHSIQTNGILIDDQWAKFLAENHFLAGISLDGPKDIHDAHRVNSEGKGSFLGAMKAIDLLKKHHVDFNILTVVNSNVARHITKVYSYFKKNDFRYLQFIPCIDSMNNPSKVPNYSLSPDRYAAFLVTLFDLWYQDFLQGRRVSIRYFDNLLGLIKGVKAEACGLNGQCQCHFVIEADGGVYPCDFYVTDKWLLGNIESGSFSSILQSVVAEKFVELSLPIDPNCRECSYFYYCRGGCRRDREPFINNKPGLNRFCKANVRFFEYALPKLNILASGL